MRSRCCRRCKEVERFTNCARLQSPNSRNPSEAVKKLKTAKIRRHKSLITNGGILCFGAFCQLFHSFSVKAGLAGGGVRPSSGAATSNYTNACDFTDEPGFFDTGAPEDAEDGRTPKLRL